MQVVAIAGDYDTCVLQGSPLPEVHPLNGLTVNLELNSNMRRIDLFCKLVGPLAIALVDTRSPIYALYFMGLWNFVSMFMEYVAIAKARWSVRCICDCILRLVRYITRYQHSNPAIIKN